jgi:hypothetical protein
MLRALLLCLTLIFAQTSAPALAQTQTQIAQTLHIAPLIDVMRAEGLKSAPNLEAELFPGQGGTAWQAAIDRIYDAKYLHSLFDAQLAKTLQADPSTAAALTDFFATDLGQKVLVLEIDARRALLDDTATEAAKTAWAKEDTAKTPRAKQIDRFVTTNDLIESNVMGALNANLAFYRGLNAGGALTKSMTETEMLDAAYAQETSIRQDTADWLFPFLMLAYQPLSDVELDQYIAFSASPAGKKSNTAIFAAFNAMFEQVSQDTGRAAARIMAGQDI